MILKFAQFQFQFKIRRPIVWLRESPYELTLKLAEPSKLIAVAMHDEYRRRDFMDCDRGQIVELLNKCGFSFSLSRLDEALQICIPGGVHLVEHIESGRLVSMMMSRHLSSPEFPFGGRIDWLATDPDHRGKGLGKLSAAMATNHLIQHGYQNIWVTTQPFRSIAINIFVSLGFIPTARTLIEYNWVDINKRIVST